MIPYGCQSINEQDIAAVTDVLKSELLTQGPVVPLFEAAVTKLISDTDQVYAVAVNSATSALHIACLALGVKAGDYVWTSANSFAASSNCALYCGAKVDFVDIDPLSLNMCVLDLSDKLQAAALKGQLPKVIIPVDFAGRSADMNAINSLAKQYGFKIIEDASHAIGGQYQSKKIGGHGLADITVFSFHPVKIITTAEGGMAVTKDPTLAEKLRLLRSHGITRDSKLFSTSDSGPWVYQQIDLGFNYRMTELHAALGISQLARIDQFLARRREIASAYDQKFSELVLSGKLKLPLLDVNNDVSALHLYTIEITSPKHNRKQVYESMQSAGIGVNVHYIPIYWHPYYLKMGFKIGQCPNAEKYYSQALSIPINAELTNQQQIYVCALLEKILA